MAASFNIDINAGKSNGFMGNGNRNKNKIDSIGNGYNNCRSIGNGSNSGIIVTGNGNVNVNNNNNKNGSLGYDNRGYIGNGGGNIDNGNGNRNKNKIDSIGNGYNNCRSIGNGSNSGTIVTGNVHVNTNNNTNKNGSLGYDNSGYIGNGGGNIDNGNGNVNTVQHHNGTVHNMFIVLNMCTGSGADADDGDQDQDRGAAPMVAWILGFIGVMTSSIATGATAYKYNRPRRAVNYGHEIAYLIGIVVVFVAGLAEVGAAFWVSVDNRNRYGASRKIMRAAIVVLVLAVGLGGVGIVFDN